MNRYRGPSTAASSRATSQTLCQKCLKRDKSSDLKSLSSADRRARHYSYECKAPAQERPYISRPSRTQQLANPKLVPKLTSDVPNELLRKTGIADEELGKKEVERARKRKANEDHHMNGSNKRSRSISSYSSNSISAISTNISRSPSPIRASATHTGQSQTLSNLNVDRKRRRSSASMSFTSGSSSKGERRRHHSRDLVRDGHETDVLFGDGQDKGLGPKSRRHLRSRSRSYTSDTSLDERHARPSHGEDRSKRRRYSSRSPVDRGRDRDVYSKRGNRRTRSPTESRDRSEVTKHRKSMTPGLPRQDNGYRRPDYRPPIDRGDSYSKDNDRYGSSARDRKENIRGTRPQPNAPPQRKVRSLSPFSKRLALTQAMNMGR